METHNWAFQQNFRTRILGEVSLIYSVYIKGRPFFEVPQEIVKTKKTMLLNFSALNT